MATMFFCPAMFIVLIRSDKNNCIVGYNLVRNDSICTFHYIVSCIHISLTPGSF